MTFLEFEVSHIDDGLDLILESGLDEIYSGLRDVSSSANIEMYENHYVTEETKKSVWARLKEFFAKLVNNFREFVGDLQTRVAAAIRKKEFKLKLAAAKERLLKLKADGVKTVELEDVWGYLDTYKKLNKEAWLYVKRFEKKRYTAVYQVENDIEGFESTLEKYDKKLEELKDNKVRMNIDSALMFLENERNGKLEVMKTLNEEMMKFDELKNHARSFETRYALVGEDMLQEKLTIIQKITHGITGIFTRFMKWIKKHVIKCFTMMIFLFA